MKNLKLDKKYNVIEERGLYRDDFLDKVELIAVAKTNNKITEQSANLLLSIVLRKEFAKELTHEARLLFPFGEQQSEIQTLFMNLKTDQMQHA